MNVRELKRRKAMAFGKSRRPAFSGTPSSWKERGRIGMARGKFEIPTALDADGEILRLFEGTAMPDRV